MKTIARFVIRDSGDANDGLMIGSLAKGALSTLKKGMVYQIREILGEMVIEEVGPSCVKPDMTHYSEDTPSPGCCWANDVNGILQCGKQVFLTEQEMRALMEERK